MKRKGPQYKSPAHALADELGCSLGEARGIIAEDRKVRAQMARKRPNARTEASLVKGEKAKSSSQIKVGKDKNGRTIYRIGRKYFYSRAKAAAQLRK